MSGVNFPSSGMISSQEVQARAETISLRFDRVRLIRHVERNSDDSDLFYLILYFVVNANVDYNDQTIRKMEELEQINLTTFSLSFVFQPAIAIGCRPIHHISIGIVTLDFFVDLCFVFGCASAFRRDAPPRRVIDVSRVSCAASRERKFGGLLAGCWREWRPANRILFRGRASRSGGGGRVG
jgi:hypothetical protein